VNNARVAYDEFIWRDIESPEHLGEVRMTAMKRFLADFPQGLKDSHAQGVEDEPRFGDLTVWYPPDTQGRHVYAVAGGRNAHGLALVRATGGPACDVEANPPCGIDLFDRSA